MHHRTILLMALLLVGSMAFSSESMGEVISASPSQTVRGEIMKVDGHTYVVRDLSGREVRLQVDSNTMMMDGTQLREGDTITADVTAKGQASYIIPGPAGSDGQTRKGAESSSSENERRPQRP
jgi:autotransporter translocation and assembly factor TamB